MRREPSQVWRLQAPKSSMYQGNFEASNAAIDLIRKGVEQ